MHYYKRNLGDYAKKAGRLSMLQHGAYTLLIDSCYDREQFPTLDESIEWTWASTNEEIEAVKFVLSRFFKLSDDGRYVQDRILQELSEYHAKADKNKTIAIERETKRKQNSTKRAQVVHEAPPNQEPLTNNHKPLKNIRGSRLPNDWIAPQEYIDFCHAERPDLNSNQIALQFKDYWIGVAGSKGVKSDWLATWRNWVRRQELGKSKFKNKSSVISDQHFEQWLNTGDDHARIA